MSHDDDNHDSDQGAPLHVDQDLTGGFKGSVAASFAKVDERIKNINHRLAEGAQKMATHDSRLDALNPKPIGKLALASFIMAVVVTIGGFVWAAATYPTRAEFMDVKNRLEQKVIDLTQVQHDAQRDVVELRDSLGRLESQQAKSNAKLDELLLRSKPNP